MADDSTVGHRAGPKLRLCWVSARPSLNGGVKSTRLIAEAMVRRGHDVTIVYVNRRRPLPWIFPLKTFISIWKWRRTPAGRLQVHHLKQSTAKLLPINRLKIREQDVPDADFCIGTWWETRQWIESYSQRKGRKVYFIRGHELYGGPADQVRETYHMPGVKLVISRWLARVMEQTYGDPNAVVVSNGVDRKQFNAEPRGKAKTPTIGMLYSPTKLKGSRTAFEAVRLVQEQIPELRVVAFGSRPLEQDLELPKNLEFHLRPEQSMIPQLYRQADCWIVSSTIEGFGMPGLEAAACRCPIVSTTCGGPEDYVNDGVSGYLVPVGDATAMADAIYRVVTASESDWRRMSDASFEISKKFDWDRSAEIMERALYLAMDGAAVNQSAVEVALAR